MKTMQLLPILALNVVTVCVALLAYDQLQREPAARSETVERGAAAGSTVDADALAQRLEALERERRRTRRGSETDPGVLERLAALELAGRLPAATSGPETDHAAAEIPAGDKPRPATGEVGEPTDREIKRFRRLQDLVRREERIEKNAARVDGALEKLQINLTPEQCEEVHRAYATFQPRVNEMWGEAKREARATIEAGGEIDRATFVADVTANIQTEFAASLNSIVSTADSDRIASALLSSGK